jgi:multiple sugar transport system substrate-binding protein
MHSPTISFKIVPTAEGGFIDPYRYNHMTEELLSGYDPEHWQEVKEALMINSQNSYPEIALKGGEEYMSTLDKNVIAAFQGVKKPEQALKETAEQWEDITERFGREEQKNQWNFLISCYGPSLRKAMNLPEPPTWVKELG